MIRYCTDCGAALEDWTDKGLRCPWAKTGIPTMVGDRLVLLCGRPYDKRPQDIAAPITGRIVS